MPLPLMALVGCGAAPRSGDGITFEHASDAWGRGRVPRGDGKRARGVLRTKPFGKGVDGTVLEVEGTGRIVDYRAPAQHRALSGHTVEVTGRDCDPQGQAVASTARRTWSYPCAAR